MKNIVKPLKIRFEMGKGGFRPKILCQYLLIIFICAIFSSGVFGEKNYELDELTRLEVQRLMASKLFEIPIDQIDAGTVGANYTYNDYGNPNTNYCTGYDGKHSGIDIQTKDVVGNTNLVYRKFFSLTRGVVIKAGGDTWNTIAIYDEKKNITAIYLHAYSADVVPIPVTLAVNQIIEIGDALGYQGDVGAPAGEHVHFEVRNGKYPYPACGQSDYTLDPVEIAYDYLSNAIGFNLHNTIKVINYSGRTMCYDNTLYDGSTGKWTTPYDWDSGYREGDFRVTFRIVNTGAEPIFIETLFLSIYDLKGKLIRGMKALDRTSTKIDPNINMEAGSDYKFEEAWASFSHDEINEYLIVAEASIGGKLYQLQNKDYILWDKEPVGHKLTVTEFPLVLKTFLSPSENARNLWELMTPPTGTGRLDASYELHNISSSPVHIAEYFISIKKGEMSQYMCIPGTDQKKITDIDLEPGGSLRFPPGLPQGVTSNSVRSSLNSSGMAYYDFAANEGGYYNVAANVTVNGQTYDIGVQDLKVLGSPTLLSINITGWSVVSEVSGTQYTCTAYYGDGNAVDVTGSATWTLEGSSYAAINNSGYLTTSAVPSVQYCRIRASYGGMYDLFNVTIEPKGSKLQSPYNLTASKGIYSDRIEIDWSIAPNTDKISIDRKRDDESWIGLGWTNTLTSHTDTDFLQTGSIYYYRVRAHNTATGDVSVYSNEDSGFLKEPGADEKTPQNVNATNDSANFIQLTCDWIANIEGWKVYRSESPNGTYALIETYDNNQGFVYNDYSPEPGIYYYYKLTSYGSFGESPPSSPVGGSKLLYIGGISPTGGSPGDTVTIINSEYPPEYPFGLGANQGAVFFGSIPATVISWSNEQVTATVPEGSGTVGVTVSSLAGIPGINSKTFTYDSPPTLANIGITGPEEVEENSGAQYNCTAYYSDGSSSNVNGTATWSVDSTYAAINNSGYLTTSSIPSDQSCRISVTYTDENVTKRANQDITIFKPRITVITPNGGESFDVGSALIISWETAGTLDYVKIEYSIDNGSTWITETDSVINDNNYEWTVPGNPSHNCLVRISNASGGVPSDQSNAVFSIVTGSSTGSFERVSINSDGITQGDGPSQYPSISGDGRYVAFASNAGTLVDEGGNGSYQVFVHDRDTGETELVSRALDGGLANGTSTNPSISSDGRYVAFQSNSNNLVTGYGSINSQYQVYLHDRQLNQTSLVTVSLSGGYPVFGSSFPMISPDGNYIVFDSESNELVPGDTNPQGDVFCYDRNTGQIQQISSPQNASTLQIAMSGSVSSGGRYVVFMSNIKYVPTVTNDRKHIYLYDRQSNQFELISASLAGTQADQSSYAPSISADGNYVVFESSASALVPEGGNGNFQIFLRDRTTDQVELLSKAPDGSLGNGNSSDAVISANGRYVIFNSLASNLAAGDTNGKEDIFVYDRQTLEITRISVLPDGTQPNGNSRSPAISGDGSIVGFDSDAGNLVSGDTNGVWDVFVRWWSTPAAMTYTLTVQSTPETGIPITVTPNDNNGNGDGNTIFSRAYNTDTIVTLTAPSSHNSKNFFKWIIDGQDDTNSTIQLAMSKNRTVVCYYVNPYTTILQPGPGEGKDIWTTSTYSYAPGGGGPGGGLDNHELRVGGWGDLYYSLIEFDLTGLPTSPLKSVKLYLYDAATQGTGTGMYIDRITEAWDWDRNDRLWWSDRPDAIQWGGALPVPVRNSWYSIDITALFKAWQDGTYPNYGIQLRPIDNWNNWNYFYSSDYLGDPTLRPKLVIEFVDNNTPPTISIVEPDGTNNTADQSFTITWTDSDPDDNAVISLYYDTNNNGADGILIIGGLTEDSTTDSYTWDTSSLPAGDYYIYGVIDDGVNGAVVDYSQGVVTIKHSTLNNGLVAYYPFDNDIIDASGNNYNGRITGSLSYEPGVVGQAFRFDGSSYILIDNLFFPIGTGTISLWAKVDSNSPSGSLLDSKTNYRSTFYHDSNEFCIGYPRVPLVTDQWKFYTFIYQDGTSISGIRQSYVNGVLAATDTGYVNNFQIPWDGTIDAESAIGITIWNANIFKGVIDDIRIYNRVLTDTEIQTLYGLGSIPPLDPLDTDDDNDGYTENQGDCKDDDETIYPGAPEIRGDGIDQDCNGEDLSCMEAGYLNQIEQKILASVSDPESSFGKGISISGNYAIVGTWGDSENGWNAGAAYIFERSGDTFIEVAKLTASDGAAWDQFGYSVSISGDYSVVGAWRDADKGEMSGSVYVFERINGVWTQVTKLVPVDGSEQDRFGGAVSISGNYIIIGAYGNSDSVSYSGAAYVFERINGIWSQVSKLTANDPSAGYFGYAVSISGDYAVSTAISENPRAAAYVFKRENGVWTKTQKLMSNLTSDNFGESVMISDNRIVIGANYGLETNYKGSAYVFERNGETWTSTYISTNDCAAYDYFGTSVAIYGNHIFIGAPGDDDHGETSGSIYIFEYDNLNWRQISKVTSSNSKANDNYGYFLAANGDSLLVSSYANDENGINAGAVYTYKLDCFDSPPTIAITITSPNGGEYLEAGSSQNITWTSEGLTGNITIDLYKDGILDSNIGTADVHSSPFPWTINPNQEEGSDYTVKIYQGAVEDFSDNPFTIPPPPIEEPEINITHGTTEIPDGGSFNFGDVSVGNSIDEAFTIENTGNADLILSNLPISITGPHADRFSVIQQPITPIASSGTSTFIIRFAPSPEGAQTAAISIGNNDSDEAPYDIILNGTGTENIIPAIERSALIAVYESTDGNNWTNNSGWKTEPLHSDGFAMPGTEEAWFGITLSNSNGENHVSQIELSNNNLLGNIPVEIGNFSYLTTLNLFNNKLTGSIPAGLGNLSNLNNLTLQSNMFIGDIPNSFTNLVNLSYLDMSYNAIHTNDIDLRAFLDEKDPDWETTQTVAPTNISVVALTNGSLTVNWTPITYTNNPGVYRVFYSTTPGESYTLFDTTADKTISSMTVTGLTPGVTYYFVVQTRTEPHNDNQNTVDSEYSDEVSATPSVPVLIISGIVTSGGSGLQNAVMNGLPGDPMTDSSGFYTATVDYGWSGTVTPTLAGYTFTEPSTTYTNVIANQTTNYIAALLSYTVSGTITSGGMGLANVLMSGLPGDPVTDSSGFYTVTVDYGWSGTVTPKFTGYAFTEPSTTYTNVTSNQNTNYNAALQTFTISGTITSGETGLANVVMGGLPGNPVTDSSGFYTVTVDYGWSGTVTPTLAGYTFIEPSTTYISVNSDQITNYTAIVIPTITVTSPNGGENWDAGSIYNITWTSTGTIPNVSIEYFMGNGNSWIAIAPSTANSGSYPWKVPDKPSDNCLVRIIGGESDDAPSDVSNAVFSIGSTPVTTLKILSPNGGEKLNVGSTHPITWTSNSAGGDVKIDYSIDNGAAWLPIVPATANDGNYQWSIPDTPSENCLVRIAERDKDAGVFDISDGGFSIIAAPFITITSPNGGESWDVGSSRLITWTGSGVTGNVKIEFSTNNGTSWTSIAASAENTGSFNWTIPNSPSDTCLVRVGETDGSPSDASNATFSIVPAPSLTVISPNGGESWNAGSIHNITWSGSNAGNKVSLDYSPDNGTSWAAIATSIDNNGSFPWSLPASPSDNCLVRIRSSNADRELSDSSDAKFSIVPAPVITITSPNGGERLNAGTSHNITWSCNGTVGDVKIEFSPDNGSLWTSIVPSTANDGTHDWTVPENPSKSCRVRISETDGDPVDISDGPFSIVTPPNASLSITSPNGGEQLTIGSTHTITWSSTGLQADDTVSIHYSTDNGVSWTSLVPSTPNSGSFPWKVPDLPTENALIHLTSNDADDGPSDSSDAVFAIVEPSTPTITVTSPNGGESFTAGSSLEITWSASGMEKVESIIIEYSDNNGSSWSDITFTSSDAGSFNWTVPDAPSENCLVRIRLSDSDDGLSDVSDRVFSILSAPSLNVTSPNGGERWKTGSSYNITWTFELLTGNIVIDLYRGSSFDLNIATAAVDSGNFNWSIPVNFTLADDYKILLHKDNTEDYSDNPFSIIDREPNHPDFNNDGHVDILWRNYASGNNEVWLMNGSQHSSTVSLPAQPDLNWRIVGFGDFNRDGNTDILWRNYSSGQNLVWFMDGTSQTGSAYLPDLADLNWLIAGTGDFNGDGYSDILWRNPLEGRGQVWFLVGTTLIEYKGVLSREGDAWRIAGIGDFNGDYQTDILWRNYSSGCNEAWLMNETSRISTTAVLEFTDSSWQIVGTGDFNRDSERDILWRSQFDGKNMIWFMDGVTRTGSEYIETRSDPNWHIVGSGE